MQPEQSRRRAQRRADAAPWRRLRGTYLYAIGAADRSLSYRLFYDRRMLLVLAALVTDVASAFLVGHQAAYHLLLVRRGRTTLVPHDDAYDAAPTTPPTPPLRRPTRLRPRRRRLRLLRRLPHRRRRRTRRARELGERVRERASQRTGGRGPAPATQSRRLRCRRRRCRRSPPPSCALAASCAPGLRSPLPTPPPAAPSTATAAPMAAFAAPPVTSLVAATASSAADAFGPPPAQLAQAALPSRLEVVAHFPSPTVLPQTLHR